MTEKFEMGQKDKRVEKEVYRVKTDGIFFHSVEKLTPLK